MDPVQFACVICGYVIDAYVTSGEESWLREFRAISSSLEGICISGVGYYDNSNDGRCVPPPFPHMRWDDHDYVKQPSDEIPVTFQDPVNGKHGYIFHEACWRLLETAVYPENVPLDRLLNICRSLPFPRPGLGVSWGHSYGGLYIINKQTHYPWEYRHEELCRESKAYQYARYNPYDIPTLPDLMTTPFRKRSHIEFDMKGRNCFSVLPWEIREAIALFLPTKDVFNLFLSSKAFLPLWTSRSFWASRFRSGSDRDFVFETRMETRKNRVIDWETLYRLTSYALSPPGLKNRKRIWTLIKGLADLLRLHLNQTVECSSIVPNSNVSRYAIAADIYNFTAQHAFFKEGCRLIHSQSTFIPEDLATIALSFIAVGDTQCLKGMRFVSHTGTSIILGYTMSGKELSLDIKAFKGFILGIGSRGIQGLRVVSGDGLVSRWFGSPKDTPVTERLVGPDSINALKVGVDGYKIVRLAVVRSDLSHVSQLIPRISALREIALWYPAVPPQILCLNEDSFVGKNPLLAAYRPLCWIHFGGPNGLYLRSLTEICVTRIHNLYSIDFHYGGSPMPLEAQRLGRPDLTDLAELTDLVRFPIDGPGGELIQSVEVGLMKFTSHDTYGNNSFRHGALKSFKITTNRGRSVHFQPQKMNSAKIDLSSLTPLSISPGTTITGFYASQDADFGLKSLGVISQVLQ